MIGREILSSDWSVARIHRMRRRKMRLGGSSGGGGSGSGGSSDENKRLGRLHHLDSGTVLHCTVLYCTVHHLNSDRGPCSLLLHVYILVLLCRSGVFTLSIGEWPLAITVTRGLERLHCTRVILLPFYLCLDFDLGQLTTSVHQLV